MFTKLINVKCPKGESSFIYFFLQSHLVSFFVNEYSWLDRSMSDVINDVCIQCSLKKSIDFNSYLYYAHILFYCRSHMKFFKARQKSVLETCRSQFFISNIKRICRWLYICRTLILFHIILSSLLSSQQHQLNTYVSHVSNEYCPRGIFDNILFYFGNLDIQRKESVDLFNYYNHKENCQWTRSLALSFFSFC